ncbi:hypothetical protein GCM10007906_20140 [Vibrio hyugaensis]|uniref:N-acetyltransferase domain-containing protein n=2 Tax=Vibrio hyugaensis TaxID=1534743 RepID=A0ABQ5Y0E3_9VIBR|nr:GNAT family N-acetyltransferase [Vibrio hyugaensis]GLR04426.1 hypothetical protein GCM10007906_20140 [Vibrio hyugaensis]
MRIRKYKKSDFKAIDSLFYTCRPDEFKNENVRVLPTYLSESPKELKKFNESSVYVFEKNECVVGFITVKNGYIGWLYVNPDFRRLGIGKKLLSFLKIEVNENLALFTLKSNVTAIDLYTKHGFIIVEEFIDPTLENEIWIVKLKCNEST